MKATFLPLVLFISLLASGHALDLVTPAGKYLDIKVTRVDAEAVRISHREGAATVDFDDLPPAMQQEYGWTPEKSAARKAMREAEAKRIAEEERMADEAANPKKKAVVVEEAAKADAPMKPERIVDEGKLKAETEEALRESKAEAARLRAELDDERSGRKTGPKAAPPPEAPASGEPTRTEEKIERRPARPAPGIGTVSSIIGEEKTVAVNRNLLIAAGVSGGIVLLLFLLSIGRNKPRHR